MLCCIPDQLKCSVWVSETHGVRERENQEWSFSEQFYKLPLLYPPVFPFQQPHTKEGSLVSFTRWRQPLSAVLSPSPHKPSSPQGGRRSQALTEGASQRAPARAR